MCLTRLAVVLLSCSLLAVGCSSSSSSGHAAEWSYGGATGPEHWGDLDPAYELASTGLRQSPIDLGSLGAQVSEGESLVIEYCQTTIDVMNNGHTVEDNYHEGGEILVGGDMYRLAQFHLHSPSEHTLDGESFPMEMHLVHRDDDNQLAVIAIMIAEGRENEVFARLGRYVPTEPGRANKVEDVFVDAREFLPESLASYRYSGSLTTPPCTEGVRWLVLKQPIEASKEQIEAFRKIYFGNNRPVQPLNDRVVRAFE